MGKPEGTLLLMSDHLHLVLCNVSVCALFYLCICHLYALDVWWSCCAFGGRLDTFVLSWLQGFGGMYAEVPCCGFCHFKQAVETRWAWVSVGGGLGLNGFCQQRCRAVLTTAGHGPCLCLPLDGEGPSGLSEL